MIVKKLDTFGGHLGAVYCLMALSEHTFVSAGADGRIVLWDLRTPDLGKILATVSHSVYAMVFDKDQQILYIGENFSGLHAISISDFTVVATLELAKTQIFDLQLVGTELWVAQGTGIVSVIDIPNWSFKKHLKISSESIRTLYVNPEAIFAGSSDASIYKISPQNHQIIAKESHHKLSIFTLCGHNETVFSGSRDASLVRQSTDDLALETKVNAHMYAVNHLSICPKNKYLVSASRDKTVKIWQIEDLKLLKVLDKSRHGGHSASVNRILWMNERIFVSASDDKLISVWQIDE